MPSPAYAALWIFIFSLPWERAAILPGIGYVTKITGAVALGGALFAMVVNGRVRRWHPLQVTALLFVLWSGVGVFANHLPQIPGKLWTFVQLLIMLLIVWEIATTRKRLFGLLTGYVLGGYIAALDTIMTFRSKAALMRRFSTGESDPNDLAMVLALGLPMAWYLALTSEHPLMRWIWRGYVPVAVFAIGLTGSRGGMVATIVALLIVPMTLTTMSPGKLAAGIAGLALSGTLAVAYLPTTVIQRLGSTSSEVEEGRLGGRLKIWEVGLSAFTVKPIFGYGTSGFKAAVEPVLGANTKVAHNSFLSVLVEEGLVGLVIYGMMFVVVFMGVISIPIPLERRFALVLLATVIVTMLPLTWEDRKVAWFVLGFLVSLSTIAAATRSAATVRWDRTRTAPPLRRPVGARGVPGGGRLE
ncbi:MAG: O-antigen ligase family protein [Gemmatimonadales bacterium]